MWIGSPLFDIKWGIHHATDNIHHSLKHCALIKKNSLITNFNHCGLIQKQNSVNHCASAVEKCCYLLCSIKTKKFI